MTEELRAIWVCRGESCGVRIRNIDGRQIPRPAKWSDDELCPHCQVAQARKEQSKEEADALEERLIGRRVGRPPVMAGSPKSRKKSATPERRGIDAETQGEIERELRTTFDTDDQIGARLGITGGMVATERRRLGLPSSKQRAQADRHRRIAEAVQANPKATNHEIAESLGLELGRVAADRLALHLPKPPRDETGRARPRVVPEPTPEQHQRIVSALEGGTESDNQIAERIGIDRRAVSRIRKMLGLATARERTQTEREQRLRAYVEAHPAASNEEVADALGLTYRQAQKDRLRLDLPRRRQGETLAATTA